MERYRFRGQTFNAWEEPRCCNVRFIEVLIRKRPNESLENRATRRSFHWFAIIFWLKMFKRLRRLRGYRVLLISLLLVKRLKKKSYATDSCTRVPLLLERIVANIMMQVFCKCRDGVCEARLQNLANRRSKNEWIVDAAAVEYSMS